MDDRTERDLAVGGLQDATPRRIATRRAGDSVRAWGRALMIPGGVALLLSGCASSRPAVEAYSRASQGEVLASPTVLRWTVPDTDAGGGRLCAGGATTTDVDSVRVYWLPRHPRWDQWPYRWQEDMPTPIRVFARRAGMRGQPDSATVGPHGPGVYWVTHTDFAGNESCPSNIVGSR